MTLRKDLERKRNFVVDFLKGSGFGVIVPQGGYFVVADWSSLEQNIDLSKEAGEHKDSKFIKVLIKKVKIQGLSLAAQYSESNRKLGENFVRFCFVKVFFVCF